jgi:chaperonin cofactor prefoldin
MGLFKKKSKNDGGASADKEDAPGTVPSKTAYKDTFVILDVGQLRSKIAFLEGIENLLKKHGLDSSITWEEIEKLQLDYKQHNETKSDFLIAPADPKSIAEIKKKLETLQNRAEKLEKNSEKTSWQISDNFKKFHDNSARENTQLNPSTNTQKELVLDLLSKNAGLAVGDDHTEDEAPKLLGGMMKDLKAAGVDTLYIESDKTTWEFTQKLDDQQLFDLVNGKEFNGVKLLTQKEQESFYKTKCDNSAREVYLMILEARKNGIEVVNIDKRQADFDETRVAHTNLEWVDAIKKDRVENKKQGNMLFGLGKRILLAWVRLMKRLEFHQLHLTRA